MSNKNLAVPPLLKTFIFFILLFSTQPVLSKELSAEDYKLPPVIVLDFEMLGDTSVEYLQQNDALLMRNSARYFVNS